MSALFALEWVVPLPRLRAAVAGLATLGDGSATEGCRVELPDGAVDVPFDGVDEDGPARVVRPGGAAWLRGPLVLPVDEPVRAYLGAQVAGDRASIGDFSVFFPCGQRYALVSIGASTTPISRLLERSEAVRSAIAAVGARSGALATLLAREPGDPYERIGDAAPLRPPHLDPDDPASVDRFAAAVLG